MASSTRPSRRATQAVNYAEADPDASDDDQAVATSSDEEDQGGRKGKARGASPLSALHSTTEADLASLRAGSKARKKQKVASLNDISDDPDSSDSEALSPRQFTFSRSHKEDDAADKVKYKVPRVDPTKCLPVELLCQVRPSPPSLAPSLSLSRTLAS